MTRKDYVRLAEALKESLITVECDNVWVKDKPTANAVMMIVTKEISRVLAADNPRFDAERFMKATRIGAK